jgi:hypothetical protein
MVTSREQRAQLAKIVVRIKEDAEDLLQAADTALHNWLILDMRLKGSDEEVAQALKLVRREFPELLEDVIPAFKEPHGQSKHTD